MEFFFASCSTLYFPLDCNFNNNPFKQNNWLFIIACQINFSRTIQENNFQHPTDPTPIPQRWNNNFINNTFSESSKWRYVYAVDSIFSRKVFKKK